VVVEADVLEAVDGNGVGLAEAVSAQAPANTSTRCGARASSADDRPPESNATQSKIENEDNVPVVPEARLVMAIGAQTNQKGDHRKDGSTFRG
jgi:hypothetical protein